ncbi:MAG: flagellar basal body-associated FliL family protein [Gammaproteobacteria bacterium]|jgi:flagellar FliL protein
MAEQDSQETRDGAEAGKGGSGGIVRLLGLGAGLFVLMSLAQITTAIVAKNFLPGVFYGSPPESEVAMEAEGDGDVTEMASLDPPIYASLDQPLIVSYREDSTMRFLQLTVEAMARDEESIVAFQTHSPAIRNNLLTLFAMQSLDDLVTVAGKEKARAAALEEVQSILEANEPDVRIEDIYFTSFVVQ